MIHDLRLGFRQLLRWKSSTFIIVLTLGLGSGAATAVFSVIDAILLQPLPYRDAHQLVRIWDIDRAKGLDRQRLSPVTFLDYRGLSHVFADVAGWWRPEVSLIESGLEPAQIKTVAVTPNFLSVMDVAPVLGGGFPSDAEVYSAPPVALISDRLWRTRYGGSRDVLGRPLPVNGQTYTIVGVMPEGFHFPDEVDLWLGLSWDVAAFTRGAHFMEAVGRLRPGIEPGAANAELSALSQRLESTYPASNANWSAQAVPLLHDVLGYYRAAAIAMVAAVAVLLLTTCFNASSLIVTRNLTRQREIATRLALGATRSQLVKQLIGEGLVLSALGTIAGAASALSLLRIAIPLLPVAVPRLASIELNGQLLGFSLALTAATALTVSVLPAWLTTSGRATDAVKEASRGNSAGSGRWWARALAAGEVTLACSVLVAASLLVQSVARMNQIALGARTDDVITIEVKPGGARYEDWTRVQQFYSVVLDGFHARTQLAAGAASTLPGETAFRMRYLTDDADGSAADAPTAQHISVGDGYFESIGAVAAAGRFFTSADTLDAEPVMIVNDTFARQAFGSDSAIDRRVIPQAVTIGPFARNLAGRMPFRIVGVVADIRQTGLGQASEPVMYFSQRQFPFKSMFVTVRGAAGLAQVREVIAGADSSVPIGAVGSLAERVGRESAPTRLLMMVIVAFAAITAILAATGVYGALSLTVAQRRREFAIRLALGARGKSLAAGVIGQGVAVGAAGILAGLAISRAATPWLNSVLFNTQPDDRVSVSAAALLILAIIGIACVVPIVRVIRLDPVRHLRLD